MDPLHNPYALGAGRSLAALVGRDRQQEAWRVAIERVQTGRTAQPVVLCGLRGVGKTVLLSQFARTAYQREWMVAQVEAGAGRPLREAFGEALHAPLADLARPSAGRRLLKALRTALSFKASYDTGSTWSFGLDLDQAAGGGADTGMLEPDLGKLLRDLSEAADEEGIRPGDPHRRGTGSEPGRADGRVRRRPPRGAERVAGPVRPGGAAEPARVLAEAKSYAERLFVFEQIEHLAEDLARRAITEPAAAEGVAWEEDAVSLLVREASGYLYFLQQFGQDTWTDAAGPGIILADARVGAATGRAALDHGFFRARWDRATRAEQRYLRAMAADGDAGSSSGEVAERLGRARKSYGPARASLISKGLIYAPKYGMVAFIVPGMEASIERQPEQ